MIETALLIACALLLDGLLGEARHFHPLIGFGNYAARVEQRHPLRHEQESHGCAGLPARRFTMADHRHPALATAMVFFDEDGKLGKLLTEGVSEDERIAHIKSPPARQTMRLDLHAIATLQATERRA